MKSNKDLIDRAIDLLVAQPHSALSLKLRQDLIEARATNVDWIEFLATRPDQVGRDAAWRPVGVRKVKRGLTRIALQELPDDGDQIVEAVGRKADEPVVRTRLAVARP